MANSSASPKENFGYFKEFVEVHGEEFLSFHKTFSTLPEGTDNLTIQELQEEFGIIEDNSKTIKYISFNNYNKDDIREVLSYIVDRIKLKKLESIPNY